MHGAPPTPDDEDEGLRCNGCGEDCPLYHVCSDRVGCPKFHFCGKAGMAKTHMVSVVRQLHEVEVSAPPGAHKDWARLAAHLNRVEVVLLFRAPGPRQELQPAALVLVLDGGEVPRGVRRPDGFWRQTVDERVDFLQGVPKDEVLTPGRQ